MLAISVSKVNLAILSIDLSRELLVAQAIVDLDAATSPSPRQESNAQEGQQHLLSV